MSLEIVTIEAESASRCDCCGEGLDEGDKVYCAKCSLAAPPPHSDSWCRAWRTEEGFFECYNTHRPWPWPCHMPAPDFCPRCGRPIR